LVIQTKYMLNFIHQECNYLLLNFILICLLLSSEIVAENNAIFPKFIIGLSPKNVFINDIMLGFFSLYI
jgi:hypothetical protein